MSRSFLPEFSVQHSGLRSPSPPPRSAIEPLSPPPGWHPSLSRRRATSSSRKRDYEQFQHEGQYRIGVDGLNGFPRIPSGRHSKLPMTPRPPPSALDVFAAVATSPSIAQDIISPTAFQSTSSKAVLPPGHTPLDQPAFERSSKRSRSEVFSERPAISQENRPITSHVPSLLHHYGPATAGRNHAVQSSGVLEQDAELLLMFSRGFQHHIPPNATTSDALRPLFDASLLTSATPAARTLTAPFDITTPTEQRARESKPLLPSFAHSPESTKILYTDDQTAQHAAIGSKDLTPSEGQSSEPLRPREHRGWPKGKPRGPRGAGTARKRKVEQGSKRVDAKDNADVPTGERKRGKQRKATSSNVSNTLAVGNSGVLRPSRRHSVHSILPQAPAVLSRSPPRSASAPRDPYAGLLAVQGPSSSSKVSLRGRKQRRSPDDTEFCPMCKADSKPMQATQDLWINCNGCKAWIHAGCAGFDTERRVKEVDKFYCKRCEGQRGQTTYVRKSSRAHASVDYAGLNEGKIRASEDVFGHHYIEPIKNGTFKFPPETFARMPPELVNAEYFAKTGGWKEPILIPAELNPRPKPVPIEGESTVISETSNPDAYTGTSADAFSSKYDYACVPDDGQDKLDMVMPHGLTVRRVADLHGPETKLAVIDVKLQEGEDKWSLGRWADYYEATGDKPVRNVISLEVSRSRLGRLIRRPKVVRDLDLQDSVWPDDETAKGSFPRVQFYCLMSVADCYTDFHIDFGGSSVYYHILKGRKTFFFIPPTQKNLKKYEDWCKSPNQNNIWLGDETKECYRVDLYPGDTMLIPSGWIHSVWTPEDSLVIGGNFLTRLHYGMQINVHAIEKATEVSAQFRYPFFQKIMWLAIARYLERDPVPSTVVDVLCSGAVFERKDPVWVEALSDGDMDEGKDDPELFNARYYPEAELEGLPELLRFVHRTAMISHGLVPGITKKQQEAVGRSIPKAYGDPIEMLKTGAIWAAWKRGNEPIPNWAMPEAPLSELEPVSSEKKVSIATQKRLERQAILDAVKRDPNARTLRPPSDRTSVESTPTKPPAPVAANGSPEGSSRPACDHCRNRKRRCDHKTAGADPNDIARWDPVAPRFGVKLIGSRSSAEANEAGEPLPIQSAPVETSAESSYVKKEIPQAEAVVKPALPAQGSQTPMAIPAQGNTIQMPTVPSAEALPFNAAQFAAPLPPLGMQAPVGDGVTGSVDSSPLNQTKRPKTKACADCKKSKRRCVHDEYGQIDPIKAQEAPQPRGQASVKRNKSVSGEGSRPGSSKKAKRESDAVSDFPAFNELNSSTIVPLAMPPFLPQTIPNGLDVAVGEGSTSVQMPRTVLDPALESLGLPEADERQSNRPQERSSLDRKERSRSRTSSSNQQTSGSDSAKAAYSTTASPLTEPDTISPYFNGASSVGDLSSTEQVMNGMEDDPGSKPSPNEAPQAGQIVTVAGIPEIVAGHSMDIAKTDAGKSPLEDEDESVRLARLLAGQEHGLRRRG